MHTDKHPINAPFQYPKLPCTLDGYILTKMVQLSFRKKLLKGENAVFTSAQLAITIDMDLVFNSNLMADIGNEFFSLPPVATSMLRNQIANLFRYWDEITIAYNLGLGPIDHLLNHSFSLCT